MTEIVLKPSRIIFLKQYLLAALLVAIAVGIGYYQLHADQTALSAALGLAGILLLTPEYHIARRTYRITPIKVVEEKGILRKKRMAVSMIAITDVEVHQNYLQRLTGYGTLVLGSASGKGILELHGVHHPKKLAHKIETMIGDMGSPTPSAPTVTTQ